MRFRFSITYLIIAALVLFTFNADLKAQSNEELINQLRGKAETPQRDIEQLTEAYQRAIEYLLPLMSADDVGSRYDYQIDLQDICLYAARPGAETERQALAGVLDENIKQTEMPETVRNWFVLQLERIGKGESVATLTKLLASKDKHLRDYARRSLENNPDPGATEALLKELSTAKDPQWKTGLINSLGLRKSEKAIEPLTGLIKDNNSTVAATAATALSYIGTDECAEILFGALNNSNEIVSTKAARGLIDIARSMVKRNDYTNALKIYGSLYENQTSISIRAAALSGLIICDPVKGTQEVVKLIKNDNPKVRTAAVQAARHATSKEPTKALAEMLPELPSDTQIQVLDLMADHPDPDSLNVLKEALKLNDESVQSAAINSISKLGNDAATQTLLNIAVNSQGNIKEAAIAGLAVMDGPNVNNIIQTAADSDETQTRAIAIVLLGLRHVAGSSEKLLKYAAEDNDQINAAAYKALVNVADSNDITALINLLTNAKSDSARKNCVSTLKSVLSDVRDKDATAKIIIDKINSSQGQTKSSLLSTLNALGGQAALETVSAATKSQDQNLRGTAIRTLSDWPDFEAAQILVDIASKPETTLINHVLAIRGAMNLIKSNIDNPIEERAALCFEALDNCRRDDEKKLVISAMGTVPDTKIAERLVILAGDENLKTEAGLAAVELAGSMLRTNRQTAMDLAKKIQDMNISEEINTRAKQIASGRYFGNFRRGRRR